jgi:hypothetical protein
MEVFDFLNSINNTKKNLYKEDSSADKVYVPFLINKALSYFLDTALHANFMNCNSHISKQMQYEYYLHTVRKGKRYSKWYKEDPNDDTINIIKKYYDCSDKKAKEYSRILTKDQINYLRGQINTGQNIK